MIFKMFYPINYYTTADLIFLLFTCETFLYSQCCVTVDKSYKIFSQLSVLLKLCCILFYLYIRGPVIYASVIYLSSVIHLSSIMQKISYSKPEIKKDPARKSYRIRLFRYIKLENSIYNC